MSAHTGTQNCCEALRRLRMVRTFEWQLRLLRRYESAQTDTNISGDLDHYEDLCRLRMVHRFEWQLRLLRRYESAQTDTNISGDLDRYEDLRWLRVVQIILVVETVTKICIISDLWRLRERVEGQA